MKVLRETPIAWLRASRRSSHGLTRTTAQFNRARLCLLFATLACALYGFALAQTNPPSGETKPAAEKTDTNSPAATPAPAQPASTEKSAAAPDADGASKT